MRHSLFLPLVALLATACVQVGPASSASPVGARRGAAAEAVSQLRESVGRVHRSKGGPRETEERP